MPYLGNEVAEKFVSKPAVDHFSGDGSTTAFTLTFPVGAGQDILVSVDGVIQDTTSYTVSSKTLTFTAAPSSNSGNNIFVNYMARVSATVAHPATSALTATAGTFTDDVNIDSGTLFVDASTNRVGIGTTSPSQLLSISDSGSARMEIISGTSGTSIIDMGDTADADIAGIRYAHDTDTLSFRSGNDVRMTISGDGEVLMPAQPSFLAQPSTAQNNVGITDGTSVTIALGTERYDVGGNFASNTFTAPVTGKYLLSATVYILNIDSAAVYIQFVLATSNRSYFQLIDPDFGQDAVYWSFNHAQLCDMDANDTAEIKFAQYSGTIQADIQTETNFSGILVG